MGILFSKSPASGPARRRCSHKKKIIYLLYLSNYSPLNVANVYSYFPITCPHLRHRGISPIFLLSTIFYLSPTQIPCLWIKARLPACGLALASLCWLKYFPWLLPTQRFSLQNKSSFCVGPKCPTGKFNEHRAHPQCPRWRPAERT